MINGNIFYLLFSFWTLPGTDLGSRQPLSDEFRMEAIDVQANWTLEQIIALTLARHQSIFQARFDLREAEIVEQTIGLWPNPIFEYNLNNMILGRGNNQERDLRPSTFSQPIQQFSLVQWIDLWGQKWAAQQGAQRFVEVRQFALQDCIRELIGHVRTSFIEFQREQYQVEVAQAAKDRFFSSLRLLQLKERVGDLAKSQIDKANLEVLLYQQTERHAQNSLEKARYELAALIGLSDGSMLQRVHEDWLDWSPNEPNQMIEKALQHRPDLAAMRKQIEMSALRQQQAIRSAWPDFSLGLEYTHSRFQVSGDNPHTMSGKIILDIPVFQREQAMLAQAVNEQEKYQLYLHQLEVSIHRAIRTYYRQLQQVQTMRVMLETSSLPSAQEVLSVTEKAFAAGACSLLELLESQRTYLNVKLQYYDLRAEESLLLTQLQQEVGLWQ